MVNRINIVEEHLTPKNATLMQVMKKIDQSELQFVLVVNDDFRVVGTLTDGDIRRAIINGASIESPAENFMNKNFIFMMEGESVEIAKKLMEKEAISHVPILNQEHKVLGIVAKNFKPLVKNDHTPVFLLAGGLGTRLRPLTDNYPKPMIEIAGRPILDHIISELADQGFCNIIISINFRGEVIKDFFGNGEKWGINIQYVEEERRLGTVGSLSLLKTIDFNDIIVMNGDLLTQLNFRNFLDYHLQNAAHATICCRAYLHQIPFGVLIQDRSRVLGIQEKPLIKQMISAGIYVLKKSCIDILEYNTYCDMPDFIEKIINQELLVTCFETEDDWIDVGRLSDLERARKSIINEGN